MYKNLKFQKSFTLLEVLIAIFALTIGVMAAFGSISQTISATTFARDRLIASYLAQEGIEIVKNIRDSNWIKGDSWISGLYLETDRQADYRDSSLSLPFNPNTYLSLSSSLGYHYGIASQTKFSRKIRVDQIGASELEITVQVFWKNYSFETRSRITNWFQ